MEVFYTWATRRNVLFFFSTLFLVFATTFAIYTSFPIFSINLWLLIFVPLPLAGLVCFQFFSTCFKKKVPSILLQILISVYIVCQPELILLGIPVLLLTIFAITAYVLWMLSSSKLGSDPINKKKYALTSAIMGFVFLFFPVACLLGLLSTFSFNMML